MLVLVFVTIGYMSRAMPHPSRSFRSTLAKGGEDIFHGHKLSIFLFSIFGTVQPSVQDEDHDYP